VVAVHGGGLIFDTDHPREAKHVVDVQENDWGAWRCFELDDLAAGAEQSSVKLSYRSLEPCEFA
jgi:hypothetical protein